MVFYVLLLLGCWLGIGFEDGSRTAAIQLRQKPALLVGVLVLWTELVKRLVLWF